MCDQEKDYSLEEFLPDKEIDWSVDVKRPKLDLEGLAIDFLRYLCCRSKPYREKNKFWRYLMSFSRNLGVWKEIPCDKHYDELTDEDKKIILRVQRLVDTENTLNLSRHPLWESLCGIVRQNTYWRSEEDRKARIQDLTKFIPVWNPVQAANLIRYLANLPKQDRDESRLWLEVKKIIIKAEIEEVDKAKEDRRKFLDLI